ncbi:DEAD/DEAH box helicase [Marinobacter salarius]|uniref:ATP-dependent RecD-like DNA helicase n=1 Tax=Marinobacter salarius TaxID=1420917 RepID=A0A1W6KFS1_9GAMM|nr:AAA domain-containing protein [Marinobacter salarius]ARM86276.1 ATP-dependent RecD-like DNA helicase [Marinobacter salarius]
MGSRASERLARYYSYCLTDAQAGRAAITKAAWSRLPYRRLGHKAFEFDRIGAATNPSPEELPSISKADIEAWLEPGNDWIAMVWHPLVFERVSAVRHGIQTFQWAPDFLAPISILLYAHRDGRLMVVGRPRFSRECLEPAAQGALVLGAVTEADRFYDQNPFDDRLPPTLQENAKESENIETPRDIPLSEALEYAHDLFIAVCQADPEQPIPGVQFKKRSFGVVLPARQGIGAIEPLLRTYDAIETIKPDLPCFNKLVSPILKRTPEEHSLIEKSIKSLVRWGTIDPTRELSPDQEEAIGASLMLSEGQLQAIHGPPGTGKTAILTEIVSSEVVLSVLEGRPPPQIVIASTNNQALRNALNAFRIKNTDRPKNHTDALIARRWIDEWPTLGFYNASRNAESDAKRHGLFTLEDIERLERSVDIQTLSMTYVQNVRAVTRSGAITSIASATDALRDHLKAEAKEQKWARALPSKLSLAVRKGKASKFLSLFTEHEQFWRRKGWIKDQEDLAAWGEVRQALSAVVEAQKVVRTHEGEARRIIRDIQKAWSEDWILKAVSGLNAKKVLSGTVRKRLAKIRTVDTRGEPVSAQAELKRIRGLINEAKKTARMQGRALTSAEMTKTWFISVEKVLHRKARWRWFWLAVHVREGQWLECMASTMRAGQNDGRALQKVKAMLERRFLLSPVMVSTLHRLPKVLSYWDVTRQAEMPLFEQADLLVVDEAGQCAPDVAAASASLAKRMVAVGDRAQLEPVWSLEAREDLGNRVAAGLVDVNGLSSDRSDQITRSGGDSSSGSLLHLSQQSTQYSSRNAEYAGVWLTHHRRCLPAIFDFCNDLAYQGRLSGDRDPNSSVCPLPPVGYLNIPGREQRQFGSRCNDFEAMLLVQFIVQNKAALQSAYDLPIGHVVAVVTPFRAQADRIDGYLRQALGNRHGITVGTVHALQGAEKPVILFGLTYNAIPSKREFFWDHSTSMFNVGVSRAQDSIIVIGDLDTLNHSGLPGRLLGKHLRTVGERLSWPSLPEQGNVMDSWRDAMVTAFGSGAQYKENGEDNVAVLALSDKSLGEVILVTSDIDKPGLKKLGNAMLRAKAQGMSVTWLLSHEYILEHKDSKVLMNAIGTIRKNGVNVQYIGPTFDNLLILPYAKVALWAERSWMCEQSPEHIIAMESRSSEMVARLSELHDLKPVTPKKNIDQDAMTA